MSAFRKHTPIFLQPLAAVALAVAVLAGGCTTTGPIEEAPALKSAEALAARPPDVPRAGDGALYPDLVPFQVNNHPPGSCMMEEEIAADLFLRIRTELMVTGLTCHAYYEEPRLYDQYMNFTVDHQAQIRKVQDIMGRFFARNQRGNRNRLVDQYITRSANSESRVMRAVSTKIYCQKRRAQYDALTGFSDAELLEHLGKGVERYKPAYSICKS